MEGRFNAVLYVYRRDARARSGSIAGRELFAMKRHIDSKPGLQDMYLLLSAVRLVQRMCSPAARGRLLLTAVTSPTVSPLGLNSQPRHIGHLNCEYWINQFRMVRKQGVRGQQSNYWRLRNFEASSQSERCALIDHRSPRSATHGSMNASRHLDGKI